MNFKHLLLVLGLISQPLFSAELTVEEKRIPKAEKELAVSAKRFDDIVAKFASEYKGQYHIKRNVAKQYGNSLWQSARDQIQSENSTHDDRSLYWARLKLSKLIRENTKPHEQYLKSTSKTMQVFSDLERASRGQNDIKFSSAATKKILITGFDPFFLDRNIAQSNPSGLAALMLDGKTFEIGDDIIQIESAIFPVRFEDFDKGEVEHFLKPYLRDNSVDMIVTISMGRDNFDLERFPGLRRSAKAPGNLNVLTGANKTNPLVPLFGAKPLKGPEFVEFSLPVDAMMTVQKPYKVNDRRTVTTTEKQFEPQSLAELDGKISVEGSGGGYLSNEISYRSINLANKYKRAIPVGHLHTPRIKGYEPDVEKQIVQQIEKILIAGVLGLKQASNIILDELTIAKAQAGFVNGDYSIKDLTAAYIARIHAQNKQGPKLNGVIVVNPDALKIAQNLDVKLKSFDGDLPPLFGVPVLVKDNIDTKDNMATTAGSFALKDNLVNKDAFLIKQLRKQGAIILGKTNLSEWANFRSERSSSGWSAVGGQAKNPYVLSRSTCGSSAGTASSISANWALIGIGTETDGSIICPASANGLVGLKPTVGLVSRTGIIPISHTQDTAGPMTRTVTDAAVLLTAMQGYDNNDSAMEKKKPQNFTDYLNKNGLQGKTIGVLSSAFNLHNKAQPLFEKALKDIESQGATLVKDLEIEVSSEQWDSEYDVLLYEFKDGVNKYLKDKNIKVKTLADLIAFNNANKEKQMPFFEQEIFVKAQNKTDLNANEYQKALKNNAPRMQRSIIELMNKHKLDLLLVPSLNPAWSIDVTNGDHYTGGSSSYAAISGYPSLTIPMGLVDELPVGISFIAKAYQEASLIEAAYAYELATKNRQKPKLLKSLID